jgi:crossover junction endonuclease EME1
MTTGGKARDRQTKSSGDDAEKRRKQEEKARDKAVKDQERIRKRALADANKHLSDRKASTREMIVDLPSTLSSETKTHVEAVFEKLEVGYSIRQSPVDNVVLWRRKVCRRFNESLGHWEPVVERLVPEKYALVVMCAPEFVEMALKGSLADHVCKMDENFPDHQVIYLLEGMRKWSSSNRAILNRQFRANVRGETSSSSGRRRAAQEPVDESVVEDALLQLQVVHDTYIHHTEDAGSTGDWIMTFTQHISAVPYKKAKEHALRDVGFCMESGQVRSGDGPKDTYLRMLQEIARVSAPMAYGIATEFDSVPALVNGLLRGGPERLSNVAKTIDSKGTLGHRTIGPAVSKRMYKIFTSRDETSTEI